MFSSSTRRQPYYGRLLIPRWVVVAMISLKIMVICGIITRTTTTTTAFSTTTTTTTTTTTNNRRRLQTIVKPNALIVGEGSFAHSSFRNHEDMLVADFLLLRDRRSSPSGRRGSTRSRHSGLGTTSSSTSLRAGGSRWEPGKKDNDDDDMSLDNRIRACIPYMLPIIDGHDYSQYICDRFPIIGAADQFFFSGLVTVFHGVPFLGIGLFLVFTIGTLFIPTMDRNVRFSAQQAALIDVSLIVPEIIASCFKDETMPRYIVEPCNNFVWYVLTAAIFYSIITNLRGKKPDQIPLISEGAEFMIGPF